ncbi:hypothetical protein VTL71DRAFT_16255 [Oculimacula yallundae]|uniref:Mid2 domain-containing protein n=1 Tax=Oculimacula yallundae TaxID=86028 RepID=A0ABR4CEM9_9HELO
MRASCILPRFLVAIVWLLVNQEGSRVSAQSTANWLFPLDDGFTINNIDTIVLQWKSNYATAWLNMWCQNGTAGNNVVLGSQFQVDSTGTYGYVLAKDAPSLKALPVACHAQLATEANGAGIDGPVGITWISSSVRIAKTFSLTASGAAPNQPVIVTPSPVPVSSATVFPTPVQSSGSNPSATKGSFQSSTTSTESNTRITPPPTLSPSSPTNSGSISGQNSNTDTKPDATNNIGAIVGGVLGGVFLLCFIIFGALFLRKYQRKDNMVALKRTPSNSWWRRAYRTTEMQTGGLHEKDADMGLPVLEKDGNQLHEVVGDMPARHEKDASLIKSRRYTPIELPT